MSWIHQVAGSIEVRERVTSRHSLAGGT